MSLTDTPVIALARPALISLARQKAERYGLDGDLLCAQVEQESGWNTHAIRFEQGFLEKYMTPTIRANITRTECYARCFSWGLMQIMGETAREFGFSGLFLSELTDPQLGLEFGCKKMSACMGKAGNDKDAALLHYNGGKNPLYVQEVKARLSIYNA